MIIPTDVQWSRRKFLAALSIAGAGSALLNPFDALAFNELDPRVATIVASTIGIDTHNHIDIPLNSADLPGPKINLSGELKKSGLSAICMTFALDYEKIQNPNEQYQRFLNGLSAMDQQLLNNGMKRALNFADLQTSHKTRQPTVIQSIEGGHFLEGKLDRLGIAYSRGLRHMGLLHDSDASVPLGDVYTNVPRYGGLTTFGTDIIRECNRLGILIDLAHANTESIIAAVKISKHPVIISHTGLNTRLGEDSNFARMMKPRLISEEQAKIIARAGGIIGVWTHLAGSPVEYVENIKALADVVGIDHVCIGTDTKLTQAYKAPERLGPQRVGTGSASGAEQGKRPVGPLPGNRGPDGTGNGITGNRPGERTNEAWSNQTEGFYFAVVDAMLKTGFTVDEIRKIGGGNFCRVFDIATTDH